jgi:RNAse (barnase) inhibitor barstar
MDRMTKQLADAQQCGVYQLIRRPEEVERAAKEAGLAIFRIDIGRAHDKKDFLAHVAKALSFPDWFGGNWDALHDCLTDLDWLSTKTGYVLLFEKSERFGASHKQEFESATAVLSAAAEYWKTQGRPFWALIAVSKKWDCGLPKWPRLE